MRRQYITHPRFQYSFTASFVFGVIVVIWLIGGASIGTLFILAKEAAASQAQQQILLGGAHELIRFLLVISVPLVLFFLVFGLFLSYKFVGPLYRLEGWLELHVLGQKPRPLKLRPGDELEPIAKALSRTIEKFRAKRRNL